VYAATSERVAIRSPKTQDKFSTRPVAIVLTNIFKMSVRIIQVRPSHNPRWQRQGGWECDEGDGVCCVACDEHARDSALSYARQRACYGPCEIQVLDEAWNVEETISNQDARPLV
jgi:hypothetical protein